MSRAITIILAAVAFVGCGELDVGTTMDICIDTEQTIEAENGLFKTLTGDLVDDRAFDTGDSPPCGALQHSVTMDRGDEGLTRISWQHPDVELAVPMSGRITVQIGEAFRLPLAGVLITDDEGVVASFAMAATSAAPPGVDVRPGETRATTFTDCGSLNATSLALTVDGVTSQVEVGTSAPALVDDNAFTFHAFAASQFGENLHCEDVLSDLSWALVRDPL